MVSIDDIKENIAEFSGDDWAEYEPPGARRLGSGCYGAAYLLPDGRVLKVARAMDGTARWICDAALAMRGTGQPMKWAPEVYAFWLHEHEDGQQMWCAIMEAVEVASESDWFVEDPDADRCPDGMKEAVHAWAESHDFEYPDSDDLHSGNWGRTSSGRYVVFDPYAADAGSGSTGSLVDVISEHTLYSQQTTANAASAGI